MHVMHHQHVRAQPCCSGRPPASYLHRLATKHPELSQTTWSRSCNPATRLAQWQIGCAANPRLALLAREACQKIACAADSAVRGSCCLQLVRSGCPSR